MSHPALIRFGDVRGHQRQREQLRTAVANGRLPHALLFAGPDGVGKRGVAMALAAWLQCETGGDDACGDCAACLQVSAGSHPDVQVVTAAAGKKDIGVDRVRELKRFTQLQPVRGKSKVAIIDDAHRLTVAAQNALLKTLEEPPERSLLILVANNPDALLPTVRSRGQRLQFSPLPDDLVIDILTRHDIDAVAARQLAAVADGSPGRALALGDTLAGTQRQRLLDQLAGLGTARYVALMQLAGELSHPENQLGAKLEMLLAHYRDAAADAARAGGEDLRTALDGADMVRRAWDAVRFGNPNRQLLVEGLLLRLARI